MIRIEDMSFNYENGKKVLNNINLTIDSGEVICLTGASGSGKTTVTRILNGTIHIYIKVILKGMCISMERIYVSNPFMRFPR